MPIQHRRMVYRVEFYRDGKCFHSKEWHFGLDTAKQHATGMLKPYEAAFSRVVDKKGRELFTYPPEAPVATEEI